MHDLARRSLAAHARLGLSPWRKGAAIINPESEQRWRLLRRNDDEHEPEAWIVYSGQRIGVLFDANLNYWLPDYSDPLTAASLILSVREAWGQPGAVVQTMITGPDADDYVWVARPDGSYLSGSCSTEVEACILALESKVAALETAPTRGDDHA